MQDIDSINSHHPAVDSENSHAIDTARGTLTFGSKWLSPIKIEVRTEPTEQTTIRRRMLLITDSVVYTILALPFQYSQ